MVSLFIYMSAYGLSVGPIIWVYLPEIVEPRMMSVCAFFNWLAHFIITLLAEYNNDDDNIVLKCLFIFFLVYSAMSCFINKKYMQETKGRSQKEIYALFDRK